MLRVVQEEEERKLAEQVQLEAKEAERIRIEEEAIAE